MDQQTMLVLHGMIQLTSSQMDDLIRGWDEYSNSTIIRKRERFSESTRVILGPVGDGCPCCGR